MATGTADGDALAAHAPHLAARAGRVPADRHARRAAFARAEERDCGTRAAAEEHVFVAKESRKIYAVDLAVASANKKPFIAKIVQNNAVALQLATQNGKLVALLSSGAIECFSVPDLRVEETGSFAQLNSVSCMSCFEDSFTAFGSNESSEIFIFGPSQSMTQTMTKLSIPSEGSQGISSIHISSSNTILCSLKPDSKDDYVDLIVIR